MSFPRGVGLLGIVAILSVALNLFLAGNQLGHHFRGPMQQPNFQQRLGGVWRDLPEADQAIARGVVDSHYNDILEKWRAFRPASQRAAMAMHADPFDPEEAKAAYEKANQRSEEFRKALQDTLIEIAQKISPNGRERLHVPGGGF
ncbi:MAG: hypothetical protein JWM91_5150 [Rhodospirillales bacterium]|nr:hypothetical protein [Rhodospirillales bacterium]